MRKLIAAFCLVFSVGLFSSCSTIRQIEDLVAKGNALADKTTVGVDKVQEMYNKISGLVDMADGKIKESLTDLRDKAGEVKDAFVAADKNKDGQISGFDEWKTLLISLFILIMGWAKSKGLDNQLATIDAKRRDTSKDIYAKIEALLTNGKQ